MAQPTAQQSRRCSRAARVEHAGLYAGPASAGVAHAALRSGMMADRTGAAFIAAEEGGRLALLPGRVCGLAEQHLVEKLPVSHPSLGLHAGTGLQDGVCIRQAATKGSQLGKQCHFGGNTDAETKNNTTGLSAPRRRRTQASNEGSGYRTMLVCTSACGFLAKWRSGPRSGHPGLGCVELGQS